MRRCLPSNRNVPSRCPQPELAAAGCVGYLAQMNVYRALGCLLVALSMPLSAEPLTVAAASNLAPVIDSLTARYTAKTGLPLRVSMASTGVLYAQIVNGAPFDVLLAADTERPLRLEQSGSGVAGTRFTYALGRLVLWSREPTLRDTDCLSQLGTSGRGHIAIANPVTAPYGRAAQEFLEASGFWKSLQQRLVYGENIAQTLQFVATGNATLGLIAQAQAVDVRLPEASCRLLIPENLHGPIEQQAILLARAAGSAAAVEFMRFMRSDEIRDMLLRSGYSVPRKL